MRHPLTKIKLLKPHQGQKAGTVIFARGKKAERLIANRIGVKEEKAVVETKEEKFILETKDEKPQLSVRQLNEAAGSMTEEELLKIIKSDERVSARRVAEAEIKRREEG